MAIDSPISPGNALLAACFLALSACSQPPQQVSGFGQLFDHSGDPAQGQPADIIRISAVGDIMLGGTSQPLMEDYGYDYPFEQVKYLFADSDIVIGNLEGPLTNRETPFSDDKEYLFRTPPERVAPALKRAGFDIMNLANNHIMDYGPGGLTDTLQALHMAGIRTVGAGNNLHQARQGTVITTKNMKIGFLGYSLTFPKSFWANDSRPGTAFGHEHQIRADVRRMKKSVDILVVSYHWGQEKALELRDYQPTLARAAIDEGASLVLGHHPHVLQAIEQYRDGVILYSLGNFTFGSYSRAADVSMVATAVFHRSRFHGLELVPINVLNVEVNFQPRLLLGADADRVIDRLDRLSRQQNTRLSNRQGVAYLSNGLNMSESVPTWH
jgi:poly-gamma-glutamate synthesis protein (capsule biosynthesis protein)